RKRIMALDAANSPELIQETVHTMLCQPVASGVLRRGPAVLVSPVELDPAQAGVPHRLKPSRLP
ncbi:hypothetical protein P4U43_09610, partial [Arthrobacter sp. EH-1B-1]|nr:hypothetical protein [Arthrobacter vasquezii]